MSHLAKPPPLKPLSVNGLTIFRLPEPPLVPEVHDNMDLQLDLTVIINIH